MSLDNLHGTLTSMVTRGKVALATVGQRIMLQMTGMSNETLSGVELLHPFGYSALPPAGADLVMLQVLGQRGHIVALGGDALGGAIADLGPGECGLSAVPGTQIVMHTDRIEITANDLPIVINAGTAPVTVNAQNITLAGASIALNAPAVTVNGHAVQVAP